ncbi:hypothetical protein ACFFQF_31640 [Haladaptatus pallidirubidus]|uniref:Secreted protein n=1 Tax=Haladaptatus pallidirubidus TaxID=1008152 RepID=A0AAV3UPN6_9EURY|nr:hypothetical protein [Haladaptatus pallidirubidus]
MKRRTTLLSFLSLFSVSTGCLGSTSSGNLPFRKRVSVQQTDAIPEHYPVDLTIEAVQAEITKTQTAHLKATAKNTGEATREFEPAYYKGASSRASDSGILLYSLRAPDSPPADSAPDCIGSDGKSQKNLRWSNEYSGTETLEPDESSNEELIVVDDPTVGGCIPTGEYIFEDQYNISDENGYDETFTWGFTLRVDDVSTEKTQ